MRCALWELLAEKRLNHHFFPLPYIDLHFDVVSTIFALTKCAVPAVLEWKLRAGNEAQTRLLYSYDTFYANSPNIYFQRAMWSTTTNMDQPWESTGEWKTRRNQRGHANTKVMGKHFSNLNYAPLMKFIASRATFGVFSVAFITWRWRSRCVAPTCCILAQWPLFSLDDLIRRIWGSAWWMMFYHSASLAMWRKKLLQWELENKDTDNGTNLSWWKSQTSVMEIFMNI